MTGQLARKRTVHECDMCGKKSAWGPNWSWYGSYRDMDDGYIVKFCSAKCAPPSYEAKKMVENKRAAK